MIVYEKLYKNAKLIPTETALSEKQKKTKYK